MSESDAARRVLAQCASCGAVYASHRCADGGIVPIGLRRGCTCGESDLRAV